MDRQPLPETLTAGPFLLRQLTPEDRDAVVAGLDDPDIAAFTTVPSPYGPSDFDEWFPIATDMRDTGSGVNFLIVDDGTAAGSIGALGLDWEAATARIGYLVYAEHRGRGIASAAVHAVCSWLLETGFRRVTADVVVGNNGSVATLRRAGFTHEGTLRSVHAGTCGVDLDRIDLELFSLLPGELRPI